jgi:hypothetical protein
VIVGEMKWRIKILGQIMIIGSFFGDFRDFHGFQLHASKLCVWAQVLWTIRIFGQKVFGVFPLFFVGFLSVFVFQVLNYLFRTKMENL